MNFFQLQNKLFYSKKEDAGNLDTEGEENFIPFLLNRWLSFYNNDMCVFTNETLNKFSTIFNDKQQSYRLYYYLIPRLKWKKISYIKKNKKEEDLDDDLSFIAKNRNGPDGIIYPLFMDTSNVNIRILPPQTTSSINGSTVTTAPPPLGPRMQKQLLKDKYSKLKGKH